MGGPFMLHRPFLRDAGLRQGTWVTASMTNSMPGPRIGTSTRRGSAFFASNLDVILRALKAETVIVTGVLTNQCVAATSKDAMYRDYLPVVVEEATGTTLPHLHAPAIKMMKVGWAEVATLDRVMAHAGPS